MLRFIGKVVLKVSEVLLPYEIGVFVPLIEEIIKVGEAYFLSQDKKKDEE